MLIHDELESILTAIKAGSPGYPGNPITPLHHHEGPLTGIHVNGIHPTKPRPATLTKRDIF